MSWALINNKVVVDICEQRFDVVEELIWVELPQESEVKTGFLYKDDQFVDPTTTDEYKENLANTINSQLNQYVFEKYDIGTVIILLGNIVLKLVESSTIKDDADVKEVIALWDWIMTVMLYYYDCKSKVLKGDKIDFNLKQYDKDDPKIKLGDMLAKKIQEIKTPKV